MAFQYPDTIRKGVELSNLDDESIRYWHEKMHIFWNQIESGTIIPGWDLYDVYEHHNKIIDIMKKRKIWHMSPINSLDMIKEE